MANEMLAKRRCASVRPPPIVELKRRLFGGGPKPEDWLDLNQAVPSYPPPEVVLNAARAAAADPAAASYTPDPGLPELRAAVAEYYGAQCGATLSAERVLVTAGANLAFSMLALAFAEPSRPVHLLTPYYFNHAMAVELCGGRVSEWRLPADLPLRDALAEGRFAAETGNLVAIVNPSNPSGRCFPRSDLEALLAHCRERGAFLVADETYLEFAPAGAEFATLTSLPDWAACGATVNTFSKSLAMTGHRVGYACAAPEVLAQVLKIQDTFVICAPHVGQRAALAGLQWDGLQAWLGERRGELASRVRTFCEALAGAASPFEIESAGAFFVYLRHPFDIDAWDVAEKLAREAGVIVLPGSCCGSEEWRRLRVAVGNVDEASLRVAAQRLSGFRV